MWSIYVSKASTHGRTNSRKPLFEQKAELNHMKWKKQTLPWQIPTWALTFDWMPSASLVLKTIVSKLAFVLAVQNLHYSCLGLASYLYILVNCHLWNQFVCKSYSTDQVDDLFFLRKQGKTQRRPFMWPFCCYWGMPLTSSNAGVHTVPSHVFDSVTNMMKKNKGRVTRSITMKKALSNLGLKLRFGS